MTVEGERLVAYRDTNGTWTIGVGHTGAELHAGLTITKETSRLLLAHDAAAADDALRKLVKVKLSDSQRFALISFVFNEGETKFRTSTLLRLLNEGDYASVPAQLRRWNKETVNGELRVNAGLVNRREAEIKLWNTL